MYIVVFSISDEHLAEMEPSEVAVSKMKERPEANLVFRNSKVGGHCMNVSLTQGSLACI